MEITLFSGANQFNTTKKCLKVKDFMTRGITTSTIRCDFHVESSCDCAVSSHGKTLRMGSVGAEPPPTLGGPAAR